MRAEGKSANGFAGNPVLAGLVPFVSLGVTVSGEVDQGTGMLVNIKFIDAQVRETAVEMVRAEAENILRKRLIAAEHR